MFFWRADRRKLDSLTAAVGHLICTVNEGFKRMAVDLNTAVLDLTTAVNTLAGNEATALADLKAAIAANDPAATQAAVDAIEAQVTNLNTINQAVVEAITPAAPPAPA